MRRYFSGVGRIKRTAYAPRGGKSGKVQSAGAGSGRRQKKALRISSGALLCCAEAALAQITRSVYTKPSTSTATQQLSTKTNERTG
jgi:hypothetical protein